MAGRRDPFKEQTSLDQNIVDEQFAAVRILYAENIPPASPNHWCPVGISHEEPLSVEQRYGFRRIASDDGPDNAHPIRVDHENAGQSLLLCESGIEDINRSLRWRNGGKWVTRIENAGCQSAGSRSGVLFPEPVEPSTGCFLS